MTPDKCSLPWFWMRPCRLCHHLCEVSQPAEDGFRAGVGDECSYSHGVWLDEAAAQAAGDGSQDVQGCHAVWTVQLLLKRLQVAFSEHPSHSLRGHPAHWIHAGSSWWLASSHRSTRSGHWMPDGVLHMHTCTIAGSITTRKGSICWPLTGQSQLLLLTTYAAHNEGRGLQTCSGVLH